MGWIGVDLDGTLAKYGGWIGPEHIGEPIQPMVNRVNDWLNSGKQVKIFTARAGIPEQIAPIRTWLYNVFGSKSDAIEITNIKDFTMIELWDDRAVQVEMNTGRPIDGRT